MYERRQTFAKHFCRQKSVSKVLSILFLSITLSRDQFPGRTQIIDFPASWESLKNSWNFLISFQCWWNGVTPFVSVRYEINFIEYNLLLIFTSMRIWMFLLLIIPILTSIALVVQSNFWDLQFVRADVLNGIFFLNRGNFVEFYHSIFKGNATIL